MSKEYIVWGIVKEKQPEGADVEASEGWREDLARFDRDRLEDHGIDPNLPDADIIEVLSGVGEGIVRRFNATRRAGEQERERELVRSWVTVEEVEDDDVPNLTDDDLVLDDDDDDDNNTEDWS